VTSTPSNLGFFKPGVEPSADPIHDEGVTILIWVSINGMHAELEHIIYVGDSYSAQRDALARIEVICAEILAMLKPGAPLNELYDIACALSQSTAIYTPVTLDMASGSALARDPAQNVTTHLSGTIVITGTSYEFLAPYVNPTARGM